MTEEIQKNKDNSQFVLFIDRIMDTFDSLLTRVTSGRFIATLLVVWTYCRMVDFCCRLVELKILSAETFLAVIAGVAALVTMMVKDLFASGNAKDKQEQNGGSTNEKVIPNSSSSINPHSSQS